MSTDGPEIKVGKMHRRHEEDQSYRRFVQTDGKGLKLPSLSPAAGLEEYMLHLAGIEWSLDSPILIQGEEDLESKRVWRDKLEPFEHQIRNLITFCRRAPVALIADDVGLGKTISAGLILSELMARRKVSRALVVCPKLIVPQWAEELKTKFDIIAYGESGQALVNLMVSKVPVVVTTYQSASRYFDQIRNANFDMLILDEAHKLRNLHGTSQAPKFALTIQDALRDRVFKYVLMLTATPIQNRLWDLYSLVDLLATAKGHENPFGDNGEFAARYLVGGRKSATRLYPGRQKEFRDHLSNYMVRTRRGDANLVFPERQVQMWRAPASDVESQLSSLISELFQEEDMNGLAQSSIAVALMSSPQALCKQLRNMANNSTISDEYADSARDYAGTNPRTGKLEALEEVIRQLRKNRPEDWRLVVFTTRKETQQAIGSYLDTMGINYGFIKGGAARQNAKVVKEFWSETPEVNVIVSTDAGAEGVNLQVCNVLVNYDLPWNPMIVEQRIGRIQRLAAKFAHVTVLNLVLAGSVEERVVGRLSEKIQAVSQSIGDIESVLESAGGGLDKDDGVEKIIRELVVASLMGQDVEQSMRKAAESIERGKQIFEEEKETVNDTIGDLNSMHRSGPKMPAIAPFEPEFPFDEFVRRALNAEDCELDESDPPVILVSRPGYPSEQIVFDEDDIENAADDHTRFFSRHGPKIYRPGKPAFERLAQSWSDQHQALTFRAPDATEEDIANCVVEWLADDPIIEFKELLSVRRSSVMQGELICRAHAAVAHDKLERLVEVQFGPEDHGEIEPDETFELVAEDVNASDLTDSIRDDIADALAEDEDLVKFCSFYEERLAEELESVGTDIQQRFHVTEQYTPRMVGESVAAKAIQYEQVELLAAVDIEGHSYELNLICIPALEIVQSPEELKWC